MLILVADDDADLIGLLKFSLTLAGFEVLTAADGLRALATFQQALPNFVLLDFNMPELGGLDVCREIRRSSNVPIMMLTARNREEDLVAALDSGADDFVTKPFSPRILLARIRALARRTETLREDYLEAGSVRLDATHRTLQLAGAEPLRLTTLETKVMELFLSNPGRTLVRDQLARHLWGRATPHERHTLKQLIYRLRQKLEADPSNPQVLQTTVGAGYRFIVAAAK